MPQSNYVVAVGQDDKNRLAIQHLSFASGTENFLNGIGIKPAMKILIVGCGAGDETVLIANKVGTSGHVTAVDSSPEQIEVAKERMATEKLTNITLTVLNAEDLDSIPEQFDIVYCRMVLVHVVDPKKVLEKMLARVKVNGKLACEEPDISTCFTIPNSKAFDKHINLLSKFLRKKGCDPDLGTKTYGIFKEIGCSNVKITLSQPAVTDEEQKNAALLSIINCGPQYISAGLATEEEVEHLILAIESEVVKVDNVIMGQCRMAQVSGTKE
jgi:ubiquinone/menaquinone biosynthesis C-methylase UbiE